MWCCKEGPFKLYQDFSKKVCSGQWEWMSEEGDEVINVRKLLKLYSLKLHYNFTNCTHEEFVHDDKETFQYDANVGNFVMSYVISYDDDSGMMVCGEE